MKRGRNPQEQVQDRRAQILETAQSFAEHPDRHGWLQILLATYGLDAGKGILIELKTLPDQNCWVHYGTWLTGDGRFLKFVADEPFREGLWGQGSGRLEQSTLDDMTAQTSTAEFSRGSGRSAGWLALDVLRQLGKANL